MAHHDLHSRPHIRLSAPALAADHAAVVAPLGTPGAASAGLMVDIERDKLFATLRARLALAGWSLDRTRPTDGPVLYIAARWGMPRELVSLDTVAEFADRVGASQ